MNIHVQFWLNQWIERASPWDKQSHQLNYMSNFETISSNPLSGTAVMSALLHSGHVPVSFVARSKHSLHPSSWLQHVVTIICPLGKLVQILHSRFWLIADFRVVFFWICSLSCLTVFLTWDNTNITVIVTEICYSSESQWPPVCWHNCFIRHLRQVFCNAIGYVSCYQLSTSHEICDQGLLCNKIVKPRMDSAKSHLRFQPCSRSWKELRHFRRQWCLRCEMMPSSSD